MNAHEVLQVQNFLVILCSLGIHSADDGGNVPEDSGVHQSFKSLRIENHNNLLKQSEPPMNIMMIENIFSSRVFPDTFPKPIVVKDELVKYKAVV